MRRRVGRNTKEKEGKKKKKKKKNKIRSVANISLFLNPNNVYVEISIARPPGNIFNSLMLCEDNSLNILY
jgi:hypothetical protein